MRMLVITLMLLMPLTCAATMYQWEDRNGTVNFTDDPTSIPEKFRHTARPIGEDQPVDVVDETNVDPMQLIEGVVPQEGEKKPKPSPATTTAPEPEQKGDPKKVKTFGGKNGEDWLKEFQRLNAEIQSMEAQLEEQKGRLADSSGMSRSEYRGIESFIKTLELRLADRRGKLNILRAEADRADVPAEFRE
jgi:hypothetical protein